MTAQIISVEQLKAGEEIAFRHLFDEYYQALCLFAVHYLGHDAEAADVVQECFIKYWNRHTEFDHLLKIRSYLYTMVRNDCLNILRNDKRRRKHLETMADEVVFRDTLLEEEAFRLFYQAVETLPRQTRRVIELALDGYNNENIALEMGISENTVHMLKKIAYKKLKVILRGYYYIFIFLLG